MSSERDDPVDEQELYEDVAPRSIFAATWFRVVLVVIVLGVIGAVAVPYVLDWMNPPPLRSASTASRTPMAAIPTPATPGVAPAADKLAEKSPSEKAASEKLAGDKRDSTILPAPMTATPTAKPVPESKTIAKAAPPEPKAPTATADASGKSTMAVTDTTAKPSTPKPAPGKTEAADKKEIASATTTKSITPKSAAARGVTPSAAIGGASYWVQVGAFKDPETAKRVAAKLREENFKVEESVRRVGGSAPAAAPVPSPTRGPAVASSSDQYDVFVSGMSVEELNRRLAGKGLSAEASGSGVIVKPSMVLRDAVALSKDLAVEGFKVQVRRAGSSTVAATAAPAAPTPAATEGGQALHRVRVGSFADKAAAVAAARELEAKGYKPFIARGDQ